VDKDDVTEPERQSPVDPVSADSAKVDFTGVQWKSVEWTNLCLLYLRAYESRLPRPILGDHFAAADVARIEYDFERIHRVVRPKFNQYMAALRTAQFDALATDYLRDRPDAVVLHLGCGLHSRAFRLEVAQSARWYDVDLPDVIALRARLYSESDTYRMVGSSVTDPGWIDDLPTGGPALIVAEGLLMYIAPDDVAHLLHRLLDRYDSGELIADLLSKWGPRLTRVLAPGLIEWGSDDGSEIARWDTRLRLVETNPIMAGFDKIPATSARLLYRLQYGVPALRNYDRLFRYTF
jgi:O-methyltransferase involved in polyketide biosynthesis